MDRIKINNVYQCLSPDIKDKDEKIRIIWIDEDHIIAYFISLNGECPVPKKTSTKQLKTEIETGYLTEITDPYFKAIDEESIAEHYKAMRDNNWEIIKYLWEDSDKSILRREKRSVILKEAAENFNTNEKKILRTISRFWQRGMTKNALLPDYENSGGKGKDKKLGKKKVGRPKNPTLYGEDPPEGINVTEDIKQIIATSLDLFYFIKQKKSLREAFNLMLIKFFSDKYIVNGKEIVKVWDESRRLNYDQFYYWYRKLTEYKKDYIARLGEIDFQLNQRELMGNSTMETFGPGYRYQIDATVADVYLLSSMSKEKLVIGRPIVYAVIDVYSRLVTGIYCGLEGPSWIGAMMALDNVVANKVEYCKQYSIEINEDEWPRSYLPEIIIADRGEFEGYNVENLVNNLNIKIENTPPYRGDLKGIVERNFRTVNEKIKHTTPGAIQKEYRDRLEKDYRLEAVLTLQQFTAIMICSVLHHNRSIIEGYPREKGMLADMVKPIPIEMWNWGLKNRRCGFKYAERDIVRLNLLPKENVAITREGIRFGKLYYSSDTAMQEQWFLNTKSRSVKIVYDPRNMNNIYIPDDKGKSFIKCFMLEKCRMYADLPIEEIIFQQELENEIIRDVKQEQVQGDINYEAAVNNIITKAKSEVRKSSGKSNRESIRSIKENRANEKERNRQSEYFELGEKDKNELPAEVIAINNAIKAEEKYKPTSKLELLKKKRDELRGR